MAEFLNEENPTSHFRRVSVLWVLY